MNNQQTIQQVEESQQFLEQLLQEVNVLEGTLAGGKEEKFGKGGQIIKDYIDSKLWFGNPTANLSRLTPELFATQGLELTELHKRQMRDQFDFYYMTLTVSASLKRGFNLATAFCELEFGPKGPHEPIIETYFPQRVWRDVLHYGGGFALGLDTDLSFNVGLDTQQLLETVSQSLPGEVKAKIKQRDKLKAHITVPKFSFKLGRAEISATGEQSSTCRWDFENPELQETQILPFVVVFKVPQGQPTISLVGQTFITTNISLLAAHLGNVLEFVSDWLKSWFIDRRPIYLGLRESWKEIALPQ